MFVKMKHVTGFNNAYLGSVRRVNPHPTNIDLMWGREWSHLVELGLNESKMQLLDLMLFLFLFVDQFGKIDFDNLEYEFSFCAETAAASAASVQGLRILG